MIEGRPRESLVLYDNPIEVIIVLSSIGPPRHGAGAQ